MSHTEVTTENGEKVVVDLPPTHPRRGRTMVMPQAIKPMALRTEHEDYPHIEVDRPHEPDPLGKFSAMVRFEPGGSMYMEQYRAIERLEPSQPLEVVPGAPTFLRMKAKKTVKAKNAPKSDD